MRVKSHIQTKELWYGILLVSNIMIIIFFEKIARLWSVKPANASHRHHKSPSVVPLYREYPDAGCFIFPPGDYSAIKPLKYMIN